MPPKMRDQADSLKHFARWASGVGSLNKWISLARSPCHTLWLISMILLSYTPIPLDELYVFNKLRITAGQPEPGRCLSPDPWHRNRHKK